MRTRLISRHRGFTLLEALVALAVVTAALLLGVDLIARQPRAAMRLRAGDEALRAIEASLETLRAGALPLRSGALEPGLAYPVAVSAENLLLDMDVRPIEPDGLFEVTVEARFRVGRQILRRSVRTLVWRPG